MADETVAAKAFSFWNYVPNFDGQTLFTFIVGTIVTLVTFWIGYKKTIGAQEERARAVNQELISSVLRRVAVEREVMPAQQFQHIRNAKSYKSAIPVQRLIQFDSALSIVLSDIIDNDFLDSMSKKTIIELIEQSRGSLEVAQPASENDRSIKREEDQAWRKAAFFSLGLLSVAAGVVSSLFSKNFLSDSSQVIGFDSRADVLKLFLLITAVIVTGVAALTAVWVLIRRQRRMEFEAEFTKSEQEFVDRLTRASEESRSNAP